jgi:hypothetical protein
MVKAMKVALASPGQGTRGLTSLASISSLEAQLWEIMCLSTGRMARIIGVIGRRSHKYKRKKGAKLVCQSEPAVVILLLGYFLLLLARVEDRFYALE